MIFSSVIFKGILLIAICVPRTILGSHSTDYPEESEYQNKRISTISIAGEKDENHQAPLLSDTSDNPEDVIPVFDSKRESPLIKLNNNDTTLYTSKIDLKPRENDKNNMSFQGIEYNRLQSNKVTSRYNDAVEPVHESKLLETHSTGSKNNHELKNDEITLTPITIRRSKATSSHQFSSTVGHENNDNGDSDDEMYTEQPAGKTQTELFLKTAEWKSNEVKKKINKKESSLDIENSDKTLAFKDKVLKDTTIKADKFQSKEFQHNIIKPTIKPETLDEYHSTTNVSIIDNDKAVKNISVNNESGSNLLEIESTSSEALNNAKVGSSSDTPRVNSIISKHSSVTVDNIQTLNETPTIKYPDKQSVHSHLNSTLPFSIRDHIDFSYVSTSTPSIDDHLIKLDESKNTIPVLKWEPTTEPTVKLISKPTKVPANSILALNESTNDSSNDIKTNSLFNKPQISTSPPVIQYNSSKDTEVKTSTTLSTVPRLSVEFKNRIGLSSTIRTKSLPTTTPGSWSTLTYSARTTLPSFKNIGYTESPVVSADVENNSSSTDIAMKQNITTSAVLNDTLPNTDYDSRKRPSRFRFATTTTSSIFDDRTTHSSASENSSTLMILQTPLSVNESLFSNHVNRTPIRATTESVTKIKSFIPWSTRLQKLNATQSPTTTFSEFETETTDTGTYPTSESSPSTSTISEVITNVSENIETILENLTSSSQAFVENSTSYVDSLEFSSMYSSYFPTTGTTAYNVTTSTLDVVSPSSTTTDSFFSNENVQSSESTESVVLSSLSSSTSEQSSSSTYEPETLSSTYSSTENYDASSSSNAMVSTNSDYSSSSIEPVTKAYDGYETSKEIENSTILPTTYINYSFSTDTTEPSSSSSELSSSSHITSISDSTTPVTTDTSDVVMNSSSFSTQSDSEPTSAAPASSNADRNEVTNKYKFEMSSTTEAITQIPPVTAPEYTTDDFGPDYTDEEDHQTSNMNKTQYVTSLPTTEHNTASSVSYTEIESDVPSDNEDDKNKNESFIYTEAPDVKVIDDVTTEIISNNKIGKTPPDVRKFDDNNNTIISKTHNKAKDSQTILTTVTTSIRTTTVIGDKTTGTTTVTDGPNPVLTIDNVPEYVQLRIDTTWSEMCHSEDALRKIIIRLFRNGTGRSLRNNQIAFLNVTPEKCSQSLKSAGSPVTVAMTFLNASGENISSSLNKDFIRLLKLKGWDSELRVRDVKLMMSSHRDVPPDEMNSSTALAAIMISCIAVVCLLLLGVLLIILRKRQKGFNYGQRCTPVSLDDYSLDNISVYNSVRRKNAIRASKCSYGNPAFDDPNLLSHPLNFGGLTSFCTNRKAVDEEFGKIPSINPKMDELPQGAETKNRYANVIPLPETRVHLSVPDGGEPISEYINANYIKGPKGAEKFYIGCQAPMQSTVNDFWRMVWEQQCKIIMMLTDLHENGVEKCYDYLPPSEVLDCHRLFGDYQVTLKKREVREKYVISLLQLKNLESNLWREVTHLWYMNWPHQGVPDEGTSIIAFLIEARSYMRNTSGPHIVHCSPGTGRTGTVIAIDLCIREFETNRSVDIPKTVYALRRDRAGAVQTNHQYAYIYQVLNIYAAKLTGGAMDSI